MGINAELVTQIALMRSKSILLGDSVIEIGAQDVCVAPEIINQIAAEYDIEYPEKEIVDARDLYQLLGFKYYKCIDANGNNEALLFDLNSYIQEQYAFTESFDLVTNLGTAEHCFNQFAVFKNLHDLCKVGGVMIHALPSQGNVNHGFYNYHPRFFVDLAAANEYEVIDLSFTVDYTPTLFKYSKEEFQKWDSHDLLLYAVMRKMSDKPFSSPFDGMFVMTNRVSGYSASNVDPLVTEFSPYLKGGDWENTKGYNNKSQQKSNCLAAFFRCLKSVLD